MGCHTSKVIATSKWVRCAESALIPRSEYRFVLVVASGRRANGFVPRHEAYSSPVRGVLGPRWDTPPRSKLGTRPTSH
jgi:hypothetical protein